MYAQTIPQVTYRPRGSKRFPSPAPIVLGITIGDVLHNQLNRLADFERPAFHSGEIEMSQKMSVRIHVSRWTGRPCHSVAWSYRLRHIDPRSRSVPPSGERASLEGENADTR